MWWSGNLLIGMPAHAHLYVGKQCPTRLKWSRLRTRPSTNPTLARARGKVGVRLFRRYDRQKAGNAYLPAERFPVKQELCLRIAGNVPTFLAVQVRIKDKTVHIEVLQQNHTYGRYTRTGCCCQGHCIGIDGLTRNGFSEPGCEQAQRFLFFSCDGVLCRQRAAGVVSHIFVQDARIRKETTLHALLCASISDFLLSCVFMLY